MFVRSTPDVATPDIQMHALPAYVIDHGRMRVKGHGMTINTCHLRPRSIGSVALHTANPDDPPAIDPASHRPYDWEKSLEGFRWGREMMRSKAYQPFVIKEYLPSAEVKTDKEIREYVKQWAKTDYHPVGSCKMGDDDLAVVDQELKVRGLDGLRGSMRRSCLLISGNTMATSTMIGEKGAHHALHGLTAPT